jgi:hypothetical protein
VLGEDAARRDEVIDERLAGGEFRFLHLWRNSRKEEELA